MSGAADSTRGIRTLPEEPTELTAAELLWVQTEAAVGYFVYNETPSGAINGSNVTFTLANSPTSGTLQLYEGNRRLIITDDYTLSGATITMTYAPPTGSTLVADYRYT